MLIRTVCVTHIPTPQAALSLPNSQQLLPLQFSQRNVLPFRQGAKCAPSFSRSYLFTNILTSSRVPILTLHFTCCSLGLNILQDLFSSSKPKHVGP